MKPATQRTSFLQRASVSAGLSILFLVIYGGCLAISGFRRDIPSFYFSWEHHVPFVAATIIPYLSIDLFFISAPFLISTRRHLRTYALRVIAAITVAGIGFLLLPLKFAFERPKVTGYIGEVFRQFQRADKPFNQLPSLHIALLWIVGTEFLRRARGMMRISLGFWFCLIGISPLLVYQHHLMDLIAGLALGLICVNLIDDETERLAFRRSWRIGTYYLAGAATLAIISIGMGKVSWPLWWPVLSLSLVASAYLLVGPSIYAKRNGRLPLATRLLFWPTWLGQVASHRWYAQRSRPYDILTDQLWIGRLLSDREGQVALDAGVGAVIDLTCEFAESAALLKVPYLHLPTLDLTAPTPAQIERAVAFISEQKASTIIYVHCKAGYSRTAVIAAAFLLAGSQADTVEQAIALLRRARPRIVVRTEARRAIEAFHKSLSMNKKGPALPRALSGSNSLSFPSGD